MQRLINLLKENRTVNPHIDPRVEDAMLKTDRSRYCPSQEPYADSPYPIGFGATISAPHMHAFALETLKDDLVEGAKVLDIGSGSGYLTACMAHMIGPRGTVFGVDHIEELVEQSKANIRADCGELLDSGRVKMFVADGRLGLPDLAPFDVIHVGATSPGLPEKLLEQLREGGQMVLPVQQGVDQIFESVRKLSGGETKRKNLLRVRYVPLTDRNSQLGQS